MTTELRFNLSEAELERIESYLKEKDQMTHFKDCCNCQGTRSDRICSDGCKRARRVLESLQQKQENEQKKVDEDKQE